MLGATVASVKLVPVPEIEPTCAKFEQPLPWQRSIKYPVTAMLSLDPAQETSILPLLIAVALAVAGAVGACVSVVAGVVAVAVGL